MHVDAVINDQFSTLIDHLVELPTLDPHLIHALLDELLDQPSQKNLLVKLLLENAQCLRDSKELA